MAGDSFVLSGSFVPEDSSLLSTHVLESWQCSERQRRQSAHAVEWLAVLGTPEAGRTRPQLLMGFRGGLLVKNTQQRRGKLYNGGGG